jgi:hypothetical protein
LDTNWNFCAFEEGGCSSNSNGVGVEEGKRPRLQPIFRQALTQLVEVGESDDPMLCAGVDQAETRRHQQSDECLRQVGKGKDCSEESGATCESAGASGQIRDHEPSVREHLLASLASLIWRIGTSSCPVSNLATPSTLGPTNQRSFRPHFWTRGVELWWWGESWRFAVSDRLKWWSFSRSFRSGRLVLEEAAVQGFLVQVLSHLPIVGKEGDSLVFTEL